MATKRPLNKCLDCNHTWYPKGRDLAVKCTVCKSVNVEYAESGGLLEKLVGWAIILFVVVLIFASGGKSPVQSTVNDGARTEQAVLPTKNGPETPPSLNGEVKPIEDATSSLNPEGRVGAFEAGSKKEPIVIPIQGGISQTQGNEDAGRIYSDEEITQMENARQYHGDDPIVRQRLGLPSRETGRLIP